MGSLKWRLAKWFRVLIVVIILEVFFRDKLYSIGIDIIQFLQLIIDGNEIYVKFFQILSFMAGKNFIIITVFLFFNFFDMYTSVIFVFMVGIGTIAIGLLKLIYKNPRPFFHEEWVKVYDCETGYGNPSGHSIAAVSMYLTAWKIIRTKIKLTDKHKRIINVCLFVFVCLILISRLALGAHSLNQIILGSFLGYSCYTFLFHVIKVDLNLHEEIRVLTNINNIKLTSFIILALLSFGIICFNFFPLNVGIDVAEWGERILSKCPNTPYSKLFDYEAYFMLTSCFILLGAYFGIYYDVKYNLSNRHEIWIEMNFGHKQWNKSKSLSQTIQRFLFLTFLSAVPLSLHILISSKAHTNIIFFLKNLLPYFFTLFCLFAFGRHLCYKFKLTNWPLESYLSIEKHHHKDQNLPPILKDD